MDNKNIILFEKYLIENEKAKNTIEKYVRDLKEFHSFVLMKYTKYRVDEKNVNESNFCNINMNYMRIIKFEKDVKSNYVINKFDVTNENYYINVYKNKVSNMNSENNIINDKKYNNENVDKIVENDEIENMKVKNNNVFVKKINVFDIYKAENLNCNMIIENYLTKEILLEYKKHLIEKYEEKASTINSKISSINAYLKYNCRTDLFLKILKCQKNIFGNKEKELTKSDMEKLLNVAQDKNERLFYLMQTLVSTGIRISELEYITVESLKERKAIVNNKGKIRPIFIPKVLCQNLMNYCQNKKIINGPIFITRNGKPINRSSVWAELKKLCKKANVDERKVFPHNFRHLFAKEFYTRTKDIVKLSSILGHSSIETTRIYILVSEDEVMENIENLGLVRGEKEIINMIC